MPGENFVLDFKFGGNAEFLARLESLMRRVDAMFEATSEDIRDTTDATNQLNKAASNAVPGINKLEGGLSRLAVTLSSVVSAYAGLNGLRKIWDFGNGSIDLYNQQLRQEKQLLTVLGNKGMGQNELDVIKGKASEIQGRTIYGDEAMIAGAGELATYVNSTKSMSRMMDLLANYAAGMTGGGEVSPQQMVDLATGLGKAFDGTYDAMRKKGFDVSELQELSKMEKEGKVVTEDMKIAALEKALKDWNGLAQTFAETDEGKIISIKNTIGDMREELGKKLLPVLANLMDKVKENLPKIEQMMDSIGNMFTSMVDFASKNVGMFMEVGEILGKVISFAFEFPTMAGMVVSALMMVKNGFSSMGNEAEVAATKVAHVGTEMEKASKKAKLLNKQSLMLAGGAAVGGAIGVAGAQNEDEAAVGALKSMGLAAAFATAQFGPLAGAVAAVASVLGSVVSLTYELFKVSSQANKTNAEMEERTDRLLKLAKMRKEFGNGQGDEAAKRINYERELTAFEAKYGSLEGSIYAQGFNGRAMGGKALEQALQQAKNGDTNIKVNSDNTITQSVTMETSLAEASAVMRTNLREFIQEQLKIDSSAISVGFAI